MKIAIICPFNNTLSIEYSVKVINFLKSKGIKLYLHKDLMKSTLIRNIGKEFGEFDELNEKVDFQKLYKKNQTRIYILRLGDISFVLFYL